MGFNLFATEGTADFLAQNGVKTTTLFKARSGKKPNLIDYLIGKKLDLVIDIPKTYAKDEITDGYLIRRRAIDSNIPLITNIQIARALVEAFERYKIEDLNIKPWSAY